MTSVMSSSVVGVNVATVEIGFPVSGGKVGAGDGAGRGAGVGVDAGIGAGVPGAGVGSGAGAVAVLLPVFAGGWVVSTGDEGAGDVVIISGHAPSDGAQKLPASWASRTDLATALTSVVHLKSRAYVERSTP